MKDIWLEAPEEHDFPAAADYLELLFDENEVNGIITKLKATNTIQKKAKDILRASNLPLLPRNDADVKKDLKKLKKDKKLSPILLVKHQPYLIVADGYHRLCACYHTSEDLEISCRLV